MQISAVYLNNISEHGVDLSPELEDNIVPQIDKSIFSDIAELSDRLRSYKKEEEDAKRKLEKYDKSIAATMEMIERAQAKMDALVKRNEFLINRLEERESGIRRALKYWKDYGIDVRKISADDDEYEQYDFMYSKLPHGAQGPTPNTETTANQGKPQSEGSGSTCVIGLRYEDGKLEIVEQNPEIIQPDELKIMNNRLTENCLGAKAGIVDYKLAMIMIRKDLIKALASLPRT